MRDPITGKTIVIGEDINTNGSLIMLSNSMKKGANSKNRLPVNFMKDAG